MSEILRLVGGYHNNQFDRQFGDLIRLFLIPTNYEILFEAVVTMGTRKSLK